MRVYEWVDEENDVFPGWSYPVRMYGWKSGEPYILHPLAVAKIAVEEIGLGITSAICALLHDTVEDTEITLDDIRLEFGNNITKIIDGLTKISNVVDTKAGTTEQAENFRKILLTLADDPRVILIKLATLPASGRSVNVALVYRR